MVSLLRILLLLSMTEASIGEETVVEMGFVKFFDSFNDEVPDMAYTGGYILIECRVSECKLRDHPLKLSYRPVLGKIDEKKEIASTADCGKTAVLRMEITEDFKFGLYKCKYGEHSSSKEAYLNYRICSPLDSICPNACRKHGNEYCVHTIHGSNPCATTSDELQYLSCYTERIGETNTLYAGIKYCGAKPLGNQPRTLCEALVEEKLHKITTRVSDPDVTDECLLKDPDNSFEGIYGAHLPYPLVKIHGDLGLRERYNDIMSVYPSSKVDISVPAHYLKESTEVIINCTLKAPNGTIIHSNSTRVSSETRFYWVSDIFESTLFHPNGNALAVDIFKFQCSFINTGNVLLADTSYYVYPSMTGREGAVINPTKSADGRVASLQCDLAYVLPARFVIKKYEWFGSWFKAMNLANETSHELIPREEGHYECLITMQMHCKKGGNLELRSLEFKVDKVVEPEAADSTSAMGRGRTHGNGQGRTVGGNNGRGEKTAVGPFAIVLLIGMASGRRGV